MPERFAEQFFRARKEPRPQVPFVERSHGIVGLSILNAGPPLKILHFHPFSLVCSARCERSRRISRDSLVLLECENSPASTAARAARFTTSDTDASRCRTWT